MAAPFDYTMVWVNPVRHNITNIAFLTVKDKDGEKAHGTIDDMCGKGEFWGKITPEKVELEIMYEDPMLGGMIKLKGDCVNGCYRGEYESNSGARGEFRIRKDCRLRMPAYVFTKYHARNRRDAVSR